MAKKSYFEFTFHDGYTCCVRGFSAMEKKVEIAKHGPIVKVIEIREK
jgi:hypothetical protein